MDLFPSRRITMSSETMALEGRSLHYKWIALSNTTIGILMATINGSILLIALPDIFRGIKLNPLAPGNSTYFLGILMGFLLVTSVLVVTPKMAARASSTEALLTGLPMTAT